MSRILGSWPMPNQTMNTGIRPNSGSVRSICISGSTEFSPSLLSPETTPSTSPAAPPTAKPIATRSSDTSMAPCSVPYAALLVVIRVTAVWKTVLGGGSFCWEISPDMLTSCQPTRTTSGLMTRNQVRLRRRAAGFPRAPGAVPGAACRGWLAQAGGDHAQARARWPGRRGRPGRGGAHLRPGRGRPRACPGPAGGEQAGGCVSRHRQTSLVTAGVPPAACRGGWARVRPADPDGLGLLGGEQDGGPGTPARGACGGR